MLQRFVRMTAVLCGLCLSACGGGSSGTATVAGNPQAASCGATSADPCAAVTPNATDYYVYAETDTPTLPAGAVAQSDTYTLSFPSVNADGSLMQQSTWSNGTLGLLGTYAADGSLQSTQQGATSCTYAPGLLGVALPQYVGQSTSSTSTESCATPPRLLPTTLTLAHSALVADIESVTLPAGTFLATKSTYSLTTTATNAVTTETGTCWIDTRTGRTVQCQWTYASTPIGQSAPTFSGSHQFSLVSYAFGGGAAVGPSIQRYAGNWSASYTATTGATSGSCATVAIDAHGAVTGQCIDSAAGASAYTLSGSVAANGTFAVSGSNGATFTGTLSTPASGQGSWTSGAVSGTWSLQHD